MQKSDGIDVVADVVADVDDDVGVFAIAILLMLSSEMIVSAVWKSVLEQIVLVYRTLSECQVVACSTGSARTQRNRTDRICQCWCGHRGQ